MCADESKPFYYNAKCVEKCGKGTVPNMQSKFCEPCGGNCLECEWNEIIDPFFGFRTDNCSVGCKSAAFKFEQIWGEMI
jgi:hypothetical protein